MSNATKVSINNLPQYLYHGSAFKQKQLMPAFKRTGILESWDYTETNEYLYLTSNKQSAIGLGFMSALAKRYDLQRVILTDNHFNIVIRNTNTVINKEDIYSLEVYLYTVKPKLDHWLKNKNDHNQMRTEYKTSATLTDEIISYERIDLRMWLKDKTFNFQNLQGLKKTAITLENLKEKGRFAAWYNLQSKEVQDNSTEVTNVTIGQSYMLHIDKNPIPVFWPMLPKSAQDSENVTTPRITVSPHLLGCLVGYDSPGSLLSRSHEDLFKGTDPEAIKEDDAFRGGYLIHALDFKHALRTNDKLAPSSTASDEHWLVTYDEETKEYPSRLVGKVFLTNLNLTPMSGQGPKAEIVMQVEVFDEQGFNFNTDIFLKKGYHQIRFVWLDDKKASIHNVTDLYVEEIPEEVYKEDKRLHATNLHYADDNLENINTLKSISSNSKAKQLSSLHGPKVLYAIGRNPQATDLPLQGTRNSFGLDGWCSRDEALQEGLKLVVTQYEAMLGVGRNNGTSGGLNINYSEVRSFDPPVLTQEFFYLHTLEANASDGWGKADSLVSPKHGKYRTDTPLNATRIMSSERILASDVTKGVPVGFTLTTEASRIW